MNNLTENEKNWLLTYKGVQIHPKQAKWIRNNRPDVVIDYCGSVCGVSFGDYKMLPWECLGIADVGFYTKNEMYVYFGLELEELPAYGKFKPYFWASVDEDGRLESYSPLLLLKD